MEHGKLSKLDQEFMDKAARDGLAEIEMAKLAQKKGKSSQVRDFADTMLDDHSHAKDVLMELADKMGLKLPGEPSGEHRSMLSEFEGYEGDEFEQRFMSTMIEEHEKDLKMYQSESEHGDSEEIKRYAAEIAPVLKKHLDMARTIHRG